ncbi:hypothetical protein C0J52_13610 [Blattella germanica]|nr:hypothetical protein C0J52_13610 [Blattella germanica]
MLKERTLRDSNIPSSCVMGYLFQIAYLIVGGKKKKNPCLRKGPYGIVTSLHLVLWDTSSRCKFYDTELLYCLSIIFFQHK